MSHKTRNLILALAVFLLLVYLAFGRSPQTAQHMPQPERTVLTPC